jgi:hypothetical protein
MHRPLPFLAALFALLVQPGARASDADAILTGYAGFSAADLQRLERGEVIARALTADHAEVAIAAAAIVRVPVRFYLDSFRAIESFKRTAEVQQIGRFSSPPSAADLRGLTIDQADVDALRKCRPGGCDVKLDAAGIRLVEREKADAGGAYREHLAAYVGRYVHEGNAALIAYQDQGKPGRLADELRLILERSPYLRQHWPLLARAVGEFGGSLPAPLQQFLYWSKEKAASKPVLSVTHAIILPESERAAVIATKQLYASHYMTASLGVTILEARGSEGAPRTLVVYINRTRLDVFDGILGRIKRPMVRSRARSGAERMLGILRERLQREFTLTQSGARN